MQLRENKPHLRSISFLYKQNKDYCMLPLRVLIHQSPFYWQFTGFLSSFSAYLLLIGIDAQVTSLWQALHLQTLSSPAIGSDFTNRHKSKLQTTETKCFRSLVSKAEQRVTPQRERMCDLEISDWAHRKDGRTWIHQNITGIWSQGERPWVCEQVTDMWCETDELESVFGFRNVRGLVRLSPFYSIWMHGTSHS